MIQYDPHRWWRQFFDLRGSMVREIVGRVTACVVWSALITGVHLYVRPMSVPSTVHSLAGTALSLLLVFRTNSSYDRFWEGRKLWGGIVNETRNLVRAAGIFLQDAPDLHRLLGRWTATFPYAAAAGLRGEVDLGPLADALPADRADRVRASRHAALAVSVEMSKVLDEGRRRGLYPEYVQVQLDQNVQLLVDYLGGCERIHKTPLPFAYMVHLRRALVLYFFTLPFAIVDQFKGLTILATAVVSYVFFGIEEIGVEIEDPFGYDANDLPLEAICDTIRANVAALVPPDDAPAGAGERRA
ncbi:MAG TPA: bestrophin family ion channel [Polyangiaceae bacterium]|nr:bestrophin family ion channel [Polyangiaceae bacterium]